MRKYYIKIRIEQQIAKINKRKNKAEALLKKQEIDRKFQILYIFHKRLEKPNIQFHLYVVFMRISGEHPLTAASVRRHIAGQ